MQRLLIRVIALVLVIAASARPLLAQEAGRLPRVFIDEAVGAASAVALARELGPSRVPFGARLDAGEGDAADVQLDESLRLLAKHNVPVWIALHAPDSAEQLASWQSRVRALLATHAPAIAIVEIVFGAQEDPLRTFVLQFTATEARAARRGVRVAIGADDTQALAATVSTLSAEAGPYIDLLVLPSDVGAASRAAMSTKLPHAEFLSRGRTVQDADARASIVRDILMTVGTSDLASAWAAPGDAFPDALAALAPVQEFLVHDVQPMDANAAGLSLEQSGRDVAATLRHRLLFDEETFSTYFVYEGLPAAEPLEIELRVATEGRPVVYDLVSGERIPIAGYRHDRPTSRARASLPLTGRPMLVNFSEGADVQFVDRTGVNAERQLSVQEIIARHRQYQARHDRLLRNYRATAIMEQHFRPSLTDPGYDVVTENEYFVDDEGVEWEERSFSVNGSKWGHDRPPFPLLQPEKVLSLPLALRLDQDYRYALDGVERVDGADCYRVHFTPTRDDAALYRGTVWIDRTTFARRQLRAVQTRTSPPVVSNEETHVYQPVAEIDGVPLLLLTKLTARQIVLIAGRNLLLEKAATFSNFRVNDRAFAEARDAARQGNSVMYRDTERGVRYFVKEGEQRIVRERATASARAMAMGVLVDPSFAFPLPIFGINYLDFEFRGRPDTQFALLFGGVLAAGNLQRPKLAGTNLDASIDFFGIAAPASDRLFVDGNERKSEALLTWPLSTGVNLGWQYTAFQKAQLQYQVRYDPFVRDRTTDESFVVPSSTMTQGLGAAWEYKRGGYSIGANGTFYARAQWAPWGPADALETHPPQTYAKYAVHVTRDVFLDVFQKLHLNASYFGGSRLDRFSRYQFGLFDDTRIHGVPASGVRFDHLAMLRGSYSFNLFEQYRLDLFAEQAWGQDRALDRTWQPLTGLGFAVNLRAPWNTILRADFGKSLLPDRYAGAGSTVFQVMLLKPLSGSH